VPESPLLPELPAEPLLLLDVLLPELLEELLGDPLLLAVDDPVLPDPVDALPDDEPDPELLACPASELAPELEPPLPEPPSSPPAPPAGPPHALPTARTRGNQGGNRISRSPSNDQPFDTPIA